jgi:hypothetical protein
MCAHFLKASVAVVSKRVLFFVVLNWLFFGVIVVGSLLERFGGVGRFWWPVGEEVFRFGVSNAALMIVSIFLFNLVLSGFVLITLSGLLFFALPVFFLCVRGLLWGIMLSGLSSSGFLLALPTLILEGEGYVLAALAGVGLGLSWLYPKWLYKGEELSRSESVKRALEDCARIYVLVVIVLFVAAVVEIATIARMLF